MKHNQSNISLRLFTFAYSIAFAFVFFVSPAFAQKAQPAQTAAQKAPTFMWKATAANGKTAYLLGSIHIGAKDFYPMSAEIETAFAQSNKLLVEADINKLDQAAVQKLIGTHGVYAGDDTLLKHLSPAATEQLKKFSADYNLPVENLTKFKPWFVMMNITAVVMMKSGYQMDLGVDKYFLNQAKDKKQIVEIESADWQFKMLASQTDEEQIKLLESTLAEAAKLNEATQKLMTTYRSGDPKQLEAIFASSATTPASVAFQKKLFDDRNPRMTDFAEQCLKTDDRCFVVVGAGHLVGKNGVVQLLKERGYKVEQVFTTSSKK